ncbi:MAG TPA: hypothetical protein VLA43_10870 [Longimicrobiales bacterium]|nr:hypothetical protein [Longimicrobiales bacterium]
MTRPVRVLSLLLMALVTACATAGSPFTGAEGEREIEIEVLNLNFSDATLHALRMGQRIRLGVVTGKQRETFTVRWPSSLPLQIEIRLLGGERCLTREMPVDPGDQLYLEIPIDLSRGGLCVRRQTQSTPAAPAPA